MAVGRWISYLRPHPNSQTPSALRLLVAAVSGAALSLSFTGFYLAVYAWICIGILMVVLFGARPRMAFACGFLHAVIFGVTSEAWIAGVLSVHGDVSPLASWGLLLMVVALWGIAAGGFAWLVNRLARRSIAMACVGAPFIWVAAVERRRLVFRGTCLATPPPRISDSCKSPASPECTACPS
jgi:apolipoprotein N-acyltransferase